MDVLNFTFVNNQALILGKALKGVVYRVQRNVFMLRKKTTTLFSHILPFMLHCCFRSLQNSLLISWFYEAHHLKNVQSGSDWLAGSVCCDLLTP